MATPLLLLLLLNLAFIFILPIIATMPFDYTNANLSTLWTIGPSLPRNITFLDGSTFLPLLLREPFFYFGFFCYSPCPSFLLSISIVSTRNDMLTGNFEDSLEIVWSANRNRPVPLNSTLRLTPDGDLILRDADGVAVWSTNTSGRGATALSLLDSGNLVLMDNESRHLWASFDHPTDSLLFGQSLKQGLRLTANSSSTNSTQGQFYLTVGTDDLYAFIDSNPPQLYYTKPFLSSSKPQNRTTYATFNNGSLDLFVLFNFTQPDLPDYPISPPAPPSIQYMRLGSNGHLDLYSWNNQDLVYKVLDVLFPSDCAYPTVCGRYGICKNGQCSCPEPKNGDSRYFMPVDAREINLGCVPVTPISCQLIERHQLVAADGVSYFNYIDQHAAAKEIVDEESCKQACLRNCSCKAAFFQYGRNLSSGSCYLPSEIFSLMVNNPEDTHYNSSAFLKVQLMLASPAANPGSPIATAASRSTIARKKKIIIGVISGFVLVCLLAFIALIMQIRRRGEQQEEEDQFGEIPGMQTRFSYEELKNATENFKNKLGQGGFGTVYEGELRNGTKVAVKRLDGVSRAKNEFLAEMKTLVGIHHINLVRLIGFCAERVHRLLVFEFMPNGSLDKWIFDRTQNSSLDWQTKCKIISDIARGLSYLHEGCRQRIAHLDIKPHNILLDDNFNAKVADFGLAKLIDRDQDQVMTRMRGTLGYLAPEWLTSVITEKVDVFSFGIVVMEIVCGRKNLDNSQQEAVHLISLLQEKVRDDRLSDLIDDKNSNNSYEHYHGEEAVAMLKLAMWCLQTDSSRRPSMSMVVKVLEGSLGLETNLNYNFFTASTLDSCNAANLNASTMPIASLLSGPR